MEQEELFQVFKNFNTCMKKIFYVDRNLFIDAGALRVAMFYAWGARWGFCL